MKYDENGDFVNDEAYITIIHKIYERLGFVNGRNEKGESLVLNEIEMFMMQRIGGFSCRDIVLPDDEILQFIGKIDESFL